MLKIALGAEFNSEKMFKDVAALASKYKGVQLHTHVAENPVSLFSCLEHRLGKACLSTQSKDIQNRISAFLHKLLQTV